MRNDGERVLKNVYIRTFIIISFRISLDMLRLLSEIV
jgi:hypothetical protein